jgi:hypothetical protein
VKTFKSSFKLESFGLLLHSGIALALATILSDSTLAQIDWTIANPSLYRGSLRERHLRADGTDWLALGESGFDKLDPASQPDCR